MTIINAHAFNAGFAGAQLAQRVGDAGSVFMCERIAVAATAMADWESSGGEWDCDDHNYDFVCDAVGELVSLSMHSEGLTLDALYRDVMEIVINGGAK